MRIFPPAATPIPGSGPKPLRTDNANGKTPLHARPADTSSSKPFGINCATTGISADGRDTAPTAAVTEALPASVAERAEPRRVLVQAPSFT